MKFRCLSWRFEMRRAAVLAPLVGWLSGTASALDIQLPAESGAFKQDTGAEIANGQCLICHSVEYVTMQPRMARAFWKGSVVKMQQKYGAPIPDGQIEPLVDYLIRNYGVVTNNATSEQSTRQSGGQHLAAAPAASPTSSIAPQIAMKYGCFGCHNPTSKIIGPAYRDIAAKYKSDPDAFSKIDEQIHKGGSGKWGPVIMPPFPQITHAETKLLADWILNLR